MDRDTLEYFFGVTSYCQICENIRNANGCEGCNGVVNPLCPSEDEPPTKFKPIYKNKEKKKMIITIIGSLSKAKEMKECKQYWERFGHTVNCPCDPGRENLPLIEKQSSWIEKIEEADLVVAIHKDICMGTRPKSEYVFEFEESTSYEMAIALRFKKQIIFW